MHEPSIPTYYVIDRNADVSEMLHFLSFTPAYCVLITKQSDYTLALQYCEDVLIAGSEQQARELAEHINKDTDWCPIIISDKTETIYANKIKEEAQEP
jgi:hypothetical protein